MRTETISLNEKKCKVLIFGIGSATEYVVDKLYNKHEIVGYSDSFSKVSVFNGKPFYEPVFLNKVDCDYLIITSTKRTTALKIYDMLRTEFDFPSNKIIPFSVYADSELCSMRYEEWMLKGNNKCTNVIVGNSHARDALRPKYFQGDFVNLAASSQDILYSIEVFWKWIHLTQSVPDVLLFDLYDYNVFNIDISMSDEVFNYISSNGLISPHNFDSNTRYHKRFSEEVYERIGIDFSEDKRNVMRLLFKSITALPAAENIAVDCRWNHINETANLDETKFKAGIVCRRFEETIRINKEALKQFTQDILKRFADTKIIFTLLPRYITMEDALEPIMENWKKDFLSFMDELTKQKNVEFWNFKSFKEISSNYRYYYDVNHLNTVGGQFITSLISQQIKKVEG